MTGPSASQSHNSSGLWAGMRAEHTRLSQEMLEDVNTEFRTFRFGVTTAAVLIGAIVAWSHAYPDSVGFQGVGRALLFLLPISVLSPSALMILNRGRTRNRKVAYIIAMLDAECLKAQGRQNSTMRELECHPVPWETALHLAFRRGSPHWSSLHKTSMTVIFALEIACVYLATLSLLSAEGLSRAAMGHSVAAMSVVILLTGYGWWRRYRAMIRLRQDDSIQGFLRRWLNRAYKHEQRNSWPRYLREFVELYEKRSG